MILSRCAAGLLVACFFAQPASALPLHVGTGATTRFLYDGDQLIAETAAAGSITAKYVYGPGIDEPIRIERDGTTAYYHSDGLGSVTALTDTAGSVLERYTYDVYGQIKITDASGNPLTQSSAVNR